MTRYLLDTNHVSSIWRNNLALRSRMESVPDAEYWLCMPSVGELWYMVFNSAQIEANVRVMEELIGNFEVADFDMRAAIEYGRIRTELRRTGTPIPAVDAQIAAIARANDLTLLTADLRHFPLVPGLRTENWLTPDIPSSGG